MTDEEVFLTAIDLVSAADRAAYLEKACGGDDEFRRRVEALLAAHFKSGSFLDEPLGQQMGSDPKPTGHDHLKTRVANRGGAGEGPDVGSPDDEEPTNLRFLLPPTRPDSLGRIGHYEVLQVVGQGGFGIVLRAFDEVLHRVVALKVLAPAIAVTSPARKRFLREARSSAAVRHENVVQVYAVEEHPLPYLVMEFIPGESLQQRLARTGPLEAPEIVRFGRQIAEGLAAAHATGLIHRDIKPCNVLIEATTQERVKITDFGMARAADDASLTRSGMLAGTPMYMAPEQAKGETLDHRADLFSLGSVLYALATGRPPFRAATTFAVLKRVVEDDPRPIRDVIPEIPQWLADVIVKLHAKKPEERFQSAREVADTLADYEAQLKANARPGEFGRLPPSKPAPGRSGRWKWVAALALLLPVLALVIAEIAGVTHWLRNQQPAPDSLKKDDSERVREERPENKNLPTDFTNTLGMKFMLIPAGKFTMGSSQEEIDHFVGMVEDEGYKRMLQTEFPEHEVEITRPFFMGTTEVTIGQFRQFIEANPKYKVGDDRWNNPGFEQTDNHPVVWVSWQNAVDFCNWLSEKEGKKYRLPTEAEWEYSCRAGKSRTRYCYGDDDAELEGYAWFDKNRSRDAGTSPVGEKKPNDWGLYDMHGNVWEWCQDWYDSSYYKTSPLKDPKGPGERGMRVQRGGSWGYSSMVCRSAFRSYCDSAEVTKHRGFRVLLVAP